MRDRGCLTSAKYNMTADVLRQTVSQDPNSGAVNRDWQLQDGNVSCAARNASPDSLVGSVESFDELHNSVDILSFLVGGDIEITKRHRVTNIRDSNGELVWKDDDGEATEFNVDGIVPMLDAFGRLIETRAILQRADG